MTSKLLSHNFLADLNELKYEKVKLNAQKTQTAIESLKELLAGSVSNKSCRLCLNPANQKIFGDNTYFDVALNIKLILGIEITENDGKLQYICTSCEGILQSAAQLRQTAEVTQRLQEELDWIQDEQSRSATPEQNEDSTKPLSNIVLKQTLIVRKWTCKRCRQTFNAKAELKEHKGVGTCRRKPPEYVCETCGLKLTLLSRLKRHRLIHTGELSYPCDICPYRGRTKYSLSMHERTHTDVRPLRCPECPATFRNSSNLASHRRSHLPPKYHCDRCQKAFKFREALQNHLATQHSNSKSYVCSFCGKAYATRKMFRRHEIKAHNCPKMSKGKTPTYIIQQDQLKS